MHGTAARIRELLEHGLPALQRIVDEAEAVIRDLEHGLDETPVSIDRVMAPGMTRRLRGNNRAPLSPIPDPSRAYDTTKLRFIWDPLRKRIQQHIDVEGRMFYPLALRVLDGDSSLRKSLATPIVQMVAEHEQIRAALPSLRNAALGYGPVRRQIERIPPAFERHTRIEEIDLFPALLLLADGNFDITRTPLHTRYHSATDVGRNLRRSRPPAADRESRSPASQLIDTLKAWLD